MKRRPKRSRRASKEIWMVRVRGTIVPFGAAILLGSMLAACQKSEDAGSPKTATGDTGHGKQIFLTLCATCHGPEGGGVKGLGKNLITSEYVHKASDEQLVAMIEKGRDAKDPLNTTGIAMPPKGGNAGLTTKDIQDVVAFVRTLK
jgi:disulfide bond formation protein DsbB